MTFLKNRYFLTGLVFVIWMCFLDKDDLLSQRNLDKKLEEIAQQKEYYLQEIEGVKSGLKDLETDPEKLEKYAREKYYMKKDNEDLFVLVEKKPDSIPTSFLSNLSNKIHSIFSKPIPKSIK